MIRAVIFDMDGVILDTEKVYCHFWMEAAREAGYAWMPEHSYQIRSMAPEFAEPYLKSLFGEKFDYYKIRMRRKEMMAEYWKNHPIEKKPGIDQLLDYLNKHYYKTAVATATAETYARKLLASVQLEHRFDQIVSAKSVLHGKPMPDVYRFVCEQIGEKPEDCIALEDSPNGVMSAFQAGCRVVMVPDLTEPDKKLMEILHGRIQSLTDLIKFLD